MTTDNVPTARLCCPECGSTRIVQYDLVPVKYDVVGLDEHGRPEFDGSCSEIIYDAASHDAYGCDDCAYANDALDAFKVQG